MTQQSTFLDLDFFSSSSLYSHGGGAKGTIVLVIADVADRDLGAPTETLALLNQGLLPDPQLVVAAHSRQDGGIRMVDVLVVRRGVAGLVRQLSEDNRQVRKLQDKKGGGENFYAWWKRMGIPQASSTPLGKGRTWYARVGPEAMGSNKLLL
jgi:hypothetical protein